MEKIVNLMKKIRDGITGERIVVGFGVLLSVLLVAFVLVMFIDCVAEWVGSLLGTKSDKKETIQLLGWVMSGALAVIGLVVLNRRAEAQEESNRLVEKGHTQERLKTATGHLGHDNASVRIAAFYEFVQLANDNKEGYRKNILKILYAHIRTTTTDSEYRNKVPESGELKPTEEVQGMLEGLFKFKEIGRGDIKPNLQRVCFSGADLANGDLSEADLSKANLSGADLSGADLSKANLSGASLSGANLSKANLSEADLSEANLSEADLSEANLSEADLLGVDLSGVDLSKANLSKAKLSGAKLSGAKWRRADLSGADLSGAKLSGAKLSKVNLSEANLIGADLSGANLSRANLSEANLSGANLSGANLSGAKLSKTDLYGTDLSGARLRRAYLVRADLSKAILLGANLSEADLLEADLFETSLTGADLTGANLTGVNLSGANLLRTDLSKVRWGGASYTYTTHFPSGFVPPIPPPDNRDAVQFPEGFIVLEKPKEDE